MAAKTIASLAIAIGVDLKGFEKDMKEFKKTWGKVGNQLKDQGTKIGVAFTAAGGAIATGLGFAVKTAMDFDAQMSRVGAIADATDGQFKSLRDTALELGANTSKSASEVAVGMELMAAMGFEATEVIAAMPGVISAAEASGEDMAMVANTVAAALNAWGLEAADASKIADVLAMSANKSAAGVQDLQFAFKYAAPLAKQLGVGIEELAAATGIMVDAGMKGEQAGTALRMAFIRLSNPPKEAAKQMAELGLQVTDAQGNMLPFADIVGQLKTGLESMGSAQRTAALAQIFGAEAASGMLNIIDAGPEKLRQLTTELQNSGGASAETAAKMKDNLAGSMEELGGAVETLQISMGSALAPAIRAVADGLSGVVNWFNNLSPRTQKFIAIGAALTAGLLILIGVIGFLIAALGVLLAAEWAVILPIAAWVAAIAGIIIVIGILVAVIIQNWDHIKAFTIAVWDAIVAALQAAWDWIVDIFTKVWDIIGPIVTAGWTAITAYFKAAFETWKTILTTAWEIIKTIFSTAFLAVYYLVTGQWDKIGGLFKSAGEKLKSILSGAWEKIKSIWSSAFESISNAASTGWEHIKGLFVSAWSAIKEFFSAIPQQMYDMGKDMIQGMIDGIGAMGSALIQAVKKIVRGAIDKAKDFLGIGSPSKVFAEMGMFTGEGFAIGLTASSGMVADATRNVAAVPLSGVADLTTSVPSVSSAGPSAAPMTVILEMDGRVIAQKTFERMGGTLRLRGAVT